MHGKRCHDWADASAKMRVMPLQRKQSHCNKVEDASAMLAAMQRYKGDNASATGSDTSIIDVMIRVGTLPRKAMFPRMTALPRKVTLPRTVDWPSTRKAMLLTVGNFAKKGGVTTKMRPVLCCVPVDKDNFCRGELTSQEYWSCQGCNLAVYVDVVEKKIAPGPAGSPRRATLRGMACLTSLQQATSERRHHGNCTRKEILQRKATSPQRASLPGKRAHQGQQVAVKKQLCRKWQLQHSDKLDAAVPNSLN